MNTDSERVTLDDLRGELDALDVRLRETIRRRLEVCGRIAELKKLTNVPMMQPNRVAFVQDRAKAFALEHGLSPDFFRRLYELIVAEACRIEEAIIDGPARPN